MINDEIESLPIVVLMPHSSCNCRCIMCDIWKDNNDQKSLNMEDIRQLIRSFRQLKTKWVVMSGGEALMNNKLFFFCKALQEEGIKITLLSTGLLLKKYATEVVQNTNEVIVSLDGSEQTHNSIRGLPNAYKKLADGVRAVKLLKHDFPITARCVIQRQNYADWMNIISSTQKLGIDQISFLAADVSSDAFNRAGDEDENRNIAVLPQRQELTSLKLMVEKVIANCQYEISSGFIAESAKKLQKIVEYYGALHAQNPFPSVKCNAPWVSVSIEADGTVRPCFFHKKIGNIRNLSLGELLNSPEAIDFRRNLNVSNNEICRKCVCTLNYKP